MAADQSSAPTLPVTASQPPPAATEVAIARDALVETAAVAVAPPIPTSATAPASDQTAGVVAVLPDQLSAAVGLANGQVLRARIDFAPAASYRRMTPAARAENIAAGSVQFSSPVSGEKLPTEKNFLSRAAKDVGVEEQGDGIDVALASPAMPATPSDRQTGPEKDTSLFGLADRSGTVSPPASNIEQLRPAAVAHRAVAAVMNVVDAQSVSRLQPAPSVHLRLTIGGEDLTIKVELRAGEVRTEFQTASPELRAALAREWSAVGIESPARVLRYLEPVYSASTSAGDQAGAGFGQPGQGAPHHGRPTPQDVFGTISRAYPQREPEAAASRRVDVPLFQPNSLHLSAVA